MRPWRCLVILVKSIYVDQSTFIRLWYANVRSRSFSASLAVVRVLFSNNPFRTNALISHFCLSSLVLYQFDSLFFILLSFPNNTILLKSCRTIAGRKTLATRTIRHRPSFGPSACPVVPWRVSAWPRPPRDRAARIARRFFRVSSTWNRRNTLVLQRESVPSAVVMVDRRAIPVSVSELCEHSCWKNKRLSKRYWQNEQPRSNNLFLKKKQ